LCSTVIRVKVSIWLI